MGLEKTLLALTAAVLTACAAPNGRQKTVFDAAGIIHIENESTWSASVPEDMCGCITFYDENGEPMDDVGEIRNGTGGGSTPEGNHGWSLRLVNCNQFDGCDDSDDDSGENAGPPGGSSPAGRRFGNGFRFMGVFVGLERIVVYDFTVDTSDSAAAQAAHDALFRELDAAPLPDGIRIRELVVYVPQREEDGSISAFEGLALDEEPIEAFGLDVNGVTEVATTGSQYVGNGFWAVPHQLSVTNLDLSASGFENDFIIRRKTNSDTLAETSVTIGWSDGR